jgi:hypothetical protein
MSKLVTKKHSYADILKGSMAQTQNKNKQQRENTGNNNQLFKCKSFNEISIIR